MECEVAVVAGPARSGKTDRLLKACRRELAGGPIGSVLWLAPTYRSAAAASARLIGRTLPGALSPNLLTFSQFADRLLAAAAPRMRPLSAAQVRSILRGLIDDNLRAATLDYFAPIAHTGGFLDLVVRLVGELKRLEIWPDELAAAQGRRALKKDRELCELYRQYQDLLTAGDLYDVQGRFWAARALLREGRWAPFGRLKHVFVDGFTDFTRTEHEVLQILAHRAQSLSISLPSEPDSSRGDLFVKTVRTLEELRRRHPGLAVEYLPRRRDTNGALAHLERHLFAHPAEVSPVSDPRGIEIVAAAGVTHEIELLAQRIKGLLVSGENGQGPPVAADDVLVVFRSLADTATLVREVFGRFGIPHVVAMAPPLKAAAITQALVAWLRLEAEDWPFRRVLAILAHNYFRPPWPGWHGGSAAVALERLVRELEIPSGRADLVRSVERLAARASADAAAKRRLPPQLLRAQLAAPLLRAMCEAVDRLPKRATAHDWAKALGDFAADVGLLAAADANPLGEEAAAWDRLAWQRLLAALAENERLSRWLGRQPPQWSLAELLDRLEDLLAHEQLPLVQDEAGCVRVLSAEAARNVSAPYVFLAGLAEKAFPPAQRDDCLLADAERRQLAAAGLPFASHALDIRFEMLLFYEVATQATRQLVLSYAAIDPAAQPLTPSPYLSEVERACGPGQLKKNAQPHLSSVPADDDVRSLRDFRVRAVSRALEGDAALLAQLAAHPAARQTAANMLAALQMSQARSRGGSFGPLEGIVDSASARSRLAERFGPDRCWSASQLEQYAYCPFQFFMEHVVRAEPVSEPELAVNYLERGRMLHWLLSMAHRRLNGAAGGATSPGAHHRAQFMEIVRSLVEQLRGVRGDRPLDRGLWEIDVRKIETWMADYCEQHAAYDGHWKAWEAPPRPAHFEVSFGPKAGDDQRDEFERVLDDRDPLATDEAFVLECDGEAIRFAGRIDRIDLGRFAGSAVFSIVDYKSGAGSKRTSLDWVLRGNTLQLPLYALATQWLLAEQAVPLRAAYWHVAGKGYREKEAIKCHVVADGRLVKTSDWETLESQVPARVQSLVAGIRGGQFPMHSADEHCTSFCPFRTVCRVNQVRALQKTWQPPGVVQK